jgi:DNA-binding transcriptional LysR family regulator
MLAGEPWVAFPIRQGASGESYFQVLAERAQKRLVEAGFGLGLVPKSSVEEELRLGTLRELRIAAMRLAVPVVLVHRRRAHLSGAARALLALLTDSQR